MRYVWKVDKGNQEDKMAGIKEGSARAKCKMLPKASGYLNIAKNQV